MSFHDHIADAAVREGDAPQDFRQAASLNAKTGLVLAATGAAVWHWAGRGWSVIPFSLAALAALLSVGATRTALKLERRLVSGHTPPSAAMLPELVDLNDVLQVTVIDDIRERYSAVLADMLGPYAKCLYKPASQLPYPKATIRRALEALLAFAEGRRDSAFLDVGMRNPKTIDLLHATLVFLDSYLEVPAESLPTDPQENGIVGRRLAQS